MDPSTTATEPQDVECHVTTELEVKTTTSQKVLKWVSNASFPENFIPSQTKIPDWYIKEYQDIERLEQEPLLAKEKISEPFDTDLLLSSSDLDTSDDSKNMETSNNYKRKKKKKKKVRDQHKGRQKERKRRRTRSQNAEERLIGSLESMKVERKSDARVWADPKSGLCKDYYFDTRGDRDNLAFGSLYRMDVARYYSNPVVPLAENAHGSSFSRVFSIEWEEDGVVLDEIVRADSRYWSGKLYSLERRKDLKRYPLIHRRPKRSLAPPGDFVALEEFDFSDAHQIVQQSVKEESWEDYITCKTREFNQLTREQPQSEALWIAFAAFQDEIVNGTSKKAVIQQVIERKISILQRALELHSDSEDLHLMYLETCKKRYHISDLLLKWEETLRRNSGSYRLWQGFLHLHRGEFSIFTVSSLRKHYLHAIQALSAICRQLHHQDETDKQGKTMHHDKVDAEKNALNTFLDLCCFEWQTGHHELAIGLFQAQIEFNLFAPPIQISERNKLRLFLNFWDSGAPRIGEEGAAGWATWLEKEEHQTQLVNARKREDEEKDEQVGGWTGWSEPFLKMVEKAEEKNSSTVDEHETLDEENRMVNEEEPSKDEEESVLLERLGLNFGSGKEVEVKDTMIWNRWSWEEIRRDCEQWFPIRTKHAVQMEDNGEEDAGEELERAVMFEDVKESLFSVATEEARFHLICQFIDFCTGPFPHWCSSNDVSWKGRVQSIDKLSGRLLEELENSCSYLKHALNQRSNETFMKLVGGPSWIQEFEGRGMFLQNVLLQCRPFFLQHRWLPEMLLTVEGFSSREPFNTKSHANRSQKLAKKLLKSQQQDILLWCAYANMEAYSGNIELARRVFDTTLTSLNTFPKDFQDFKPIICLDYAEMELSQERSSAERFSESLCQKVLHILCCLGCGEPYTPLIADSTVLGIQFLKAKQGFKDQLKNTRTHCVRGKFDDKSAALIVCAALFEQISEGWHAAAAIFEESFTWMLPGKRQRNFQFELLFLKYVLMLEQHKQNVKPAYLQHVISQALTQYPFNPQLLGAYVRCHSKAALVTDMRRFFDEIISKNPSTIIWLFALSCELWRTNSGPRIHNLFERAIENKETQHSVVLWRCYLAYTLQIARDPDSARRIFFRAIHACPWSKVLWLDGFQKLSHLLSAKELSEFQEIMREKELRLRTDVYEILLEDEDARELD